MCIMQLYAIGVRLSFIFFYLVVMSYIFLRNTKGMCNQREMPKISEHAFERNKNYSQRYTFLYKEREVDY